MNEHVMDGFRFIKAMQAMSIEQIGQFIKDELAQPEPNKWKIERAMQVAKYKYDLLQGMNGPKQ